MDGAIGGRLVTADALFALGILLMLGIGTLSVAENVVIWLEERPRTRFGRALAALERISGTHPDDGPAQ